MRARALVVALIGLIASASCRRSPAEDFPPSDPSAARGASTATPAVPSSPPSTPIETPERTDRLGRAEGRCVLATPAAVPPPVAHGPPAGCPVDPEPSLPAAPIVRVTFSDVPGLSVDAEFVRTPHDTERGLMYRTSMAENRAMLFDLRQREDHKFWMHNTCIPLDLIYIDFDGLIVGIVENAPTLNDDARSVGCPSRWVLEVNAGWARRHGVRAGQRVERPPAGPPPN